MVFDFKNISKNEQNFTEELIENYPIIWREILNDKYGRYSLTSVGEGWYNIIRSVSKEAENIVASIRHECPSTKLPFVAQVKEKFGQLRLYFDCNDQISSKVKAELANLEKKTSDAANKTCFKCGDSGEYRSHPPFEKEYTQGWSISVLCDKCWFVTTEEKIRNGIINSKKARTWLYYLNLGKHVFGN